MDRIYLDHAATAPIVPRAREAMSAALETWANPSSPHAEGRAARAALEGAREGIAAALGWRHALLFTSGASEGIGIVCRRATAGRRIVSAVEHAAVLRQAADAAVVPVDRLGVIDLVGLAAALAEAGPRPLVAVQAANSETGVLQPLADVAERVRAAGGLLMVDCAQTAGKLPLPDADFVIVSAHKLGGPPGIGALLVRDLALLEPSGGHERGYRMGTENLPAALGFAAAIDNGPGWIARAAELRAYVDAAIETAGGEVIAGATARLPTIGAYRMPGVAAAAQIIRFDLAGIALSAGSACASGAMKPSAVLAAMGMPEDRAGEVIRMSFGRATSRADLWRFIDTWKRIAGDPGAMIYLDYQATTPLAPEARAAMLPLLEAEFGNPHSPHRMGRAAKAVVELARDRVAAPFGSGGRLLFTSGATEAANWALKGIMAAAPAGRRRFVTIATEHACVLDSAEWLARQGVELVVLPVGADGLVDLDAAAGAIDGRTALVAAMLVNNEIGVIQPVAALGRLARAAGALMFCDAAQGYGRVPLPVEACDMIAISAHKLHGPKGIGALWLRDGVAPAPLLHGGGQEGGLRSGTLAPALCAGFGAAAALAFERFQSDGEHVADLSARLRARFSGWTINGSLDRRWPGNLNLRLDGLDAARLISEVRDVAFSAGSACASGSGRPSHVLAALGLADAGARASIRLGFGRYTTIEEIDRAATLILEAADRQRLWAA